MIQRQVIQYEGTGDVFESLFVFNDDGTSEREAILVFPNVLGTKESDFLYAEKLAALGYAVLVADVYGKGKRTTRDDADMAMYMHALNTDRSLLIARVREAHQQLATLPQVNRDKIAAVGFCFGGKCVLDLARSGADIRGGVSLHGVYDRPPFPNEAITAKLLICHGWDDPIAPPEATVGLAQELTEAKCDWQIHAYGGTGHAFTDESVHMPENGMAYSPSADQRSFRATLNFFDEIFA